MNTETISVGDTLVISNCKQLKEQFLASMKPNVPVVLELQDVTTCDAAGLQLLQACEKEAEKQEVQLTFRNPSPAIRQVADQLGLSLSD